MKNGNAERGQLRLRKGPINFTSSSHHYGQLTPRQSPSLSESSPAGKGPSVKSEAANEALASLYFFSRSLFWPNWSGSAFIKPADSFPPIYIKVQHFFPCIHANTHNVENTHTHVTWRSLKTNNCLQRNKSTFQAVITAPVVGNGILSRTRRRSSHPPRLTWPQLPGNMLLCYSWLVKNMTCQVVCLVLSDLVH